jgi:hypothetical protein
MPVGIVDTRCLADFAGDEIQPRLMEAAHIDREMHQGIDAELSEYRARSDVQILKEAE